MIGHVTAPLVPDDPGSIETRVRELVERDPQDIDSLSMLAACHPQLGEIGEGPRHVRAFPGRPVGLGRCCSIASI